MDLLVLLFVIALIGFGAYLIITYIPMPNIFRVAIQVLAVVVVIFYLFRMFGSVLPNVLP